MKITYIAHSGFSVELEKQVLLFDYFTGELPVWDKQKTILVFASHRHQDHFNMKIFSLREQYPHIHFFFGNDIKLSQAQMVHKKADPEALEDVTSMKAHESLVYGDGDGAVRIRSLKSTDEGVAFLVEAEGKSIYHAGDLNWWYWEGEPLSWNRNMPIISFWNSSINWSTSILLNTSLCRKARLICLGWFMVSMMRRFSRT